uniref:Uncharacterized protein n=1 Tax=Rhizophora mucronata TaxID=61149 RepID=A0A2P2NLL0_RHIMU
MKFKYSYGPTTSNFNQDLEFSVSLNLNCQSVNMIQPD